MPSVSNVAVTGSGTGTLGVKSTPKVVDVENVVQHSGLPMSKANLDPENAVVMPSASLESKVRPLTVPGKLKMNRSGDGLPLKAEYWTVTVVPVKSTSTAARPPS